MVHSHSEMDYFIPLDYSFTATVIDQAHMILGHFGPQKTADNIRRWYWWPKIAVLFTPPPIPIGLQLV